MNVDGFQGRENSVIIISLVRGNKIGDIGFTKVSNRLNVCISRAKHFMLICCNFDTFKTNKGQAWKLFTAELLSRAAFTQC